MEGRWFVEWEERIRVRTHVEEPSESFSDGLITFGRLAEKALHAIKHGEAIDHNDEHFAHAIVWASNFSHPMPGLLFPCKQ